MDLPFQYISRQFDRLRKQYPHKMALLYDGTTWNYRALFDLSMSYSQLFQENGITQGHLVIVHMSRSPEWIACILGLIQIGAVYLALDPKLPEERKQTIQKKSRASFMLTWSASLCIPKVERLQKEDFLLSKEALYVMYTSGSSGHPKGVIGSHRGIKQRVEWMHATYPIQKNEVLCMKTPLSFVDHVAELFQALLHPTPLAILKDEDVHDIHRFLFCLERDQITRLVLVPSLLKMILKFPSDSLRTIRLQFIFSSGELLSHALAEECMEKLPHTRLINIYGSTEVGADATYYEVNYSTKKYISTLFQRESKPFFSIPEESIDSIRDRFAIEPIPEYGSSIDGYITHLKNHVIPSTIDVSHPRFIGHMTSGLPEAFAELSAFLTSNHQNTVKIETSKAFTFLEKKVLASLHSLFYQESPEFYERHTQNADSCLGLLLSGGTYSNIQALHIGRHQALIHAGASMENIQQNGWFYELHKLGYEGACILGSRTMHYSIQKAALLLGIGTHQIRFISSDTKGRILSDALEEELRLCRSNKLLPIAIIGIAGSTEMGSVDPIAKIGIIAQREKIFFHVDAAWGGPLIFSARLKSLLDGIEMADSIAICGHKQMYLPLGTSVLLLKNPQTVEVTATYAHYQSSKSSYDLGAFSLAGSKPAHAVYLDAGFHLYGHRGYGYLIEQGVENAQLFALLIRNCECFELVEEPETNIVNYRYIPVAFRNKSKRSQEEEESISHATRAIQREQFFRGKTFVSYTVLQHTETPLGVFRAVFINPVTQVEHMVEVLNDQLTIAREKLGEPIPSMIIQGENQKSSSVPIGFPLQGTKIWIFDEFMKETPPGMIGQIYIGGECLALGYLHDTKASSTHFISHPTFADTLMYATGDYGKRLTTGALEYVGRKDQQVKIRGCRVDLIEVEQKLLSNPSVGSVCVLVYSEELFAFYTASSQEYPISEESLRFSLQQSLPDYMIPSHYMFLRALPLLPSGKVDRLSLIEFLKECSQTTSLEISRSSAKNSLELLEVLCRHLLKTDTINLDCNFFEMGFNSLSINNILIHLEQQQISLRLIDLYAHPTVRTLAAHLEAASASSSNISIVMQRRLKTLNDRKNIQRRWT